MKAHGGARRRVVRAAVGWLAAAVFGVAAWHLGRATDGLSVSAQRVGTTPVTVFRPARAGAAAPVVVIAHGFAGSQQLMQPFALTLARNGYIAVTFDFPGHGRNPTAMAGGLADRAASQRSLLAALDGVSEFARGLAADAGARYGVLGHSMASDIVVRHAQAHADVQATVAVSLFAPSIGAATPRDSPRNLLVVAGAAEPAVMQAEALRVVGRVAGDRAEARRTYGDFAAGTARRAAFSPGVEHIGVLYSGASLAEALAWFDAAFGRPAPAQPFIDARGPWLGLLLLGAVALAWAAAPALPGGVAPAGPYGVAPAGPGGFAPTGPREVAPAGPFGGVPALSRVVVPALPHGPSTAPAAAAAGPGARFWPRLLAPAVLTPFVLWKLPSDFLPIPLGGYLLLHFGLYGVLSFALRGRGGGAVEPPRPATLALATALDLAFVVIAVGVPLDLWVFNLWPTPARWPLIGAVAIGTLPYFLADERATRGPGAPRFAYPASKLAFLLSLVAAIALNPPKLFFLAIIVPAILLLFVVFGLFSAWVHRSTGSPWPAAIANAIVFAWFIAVTFPIVG